MSANEVAAAPAAAATATAEAKPDILDDMMKATRIADRPAAKDMLKTVIDEALKGTVTWDKNVTKSINAGIQAIDKVISEQLAAIMHAPEFQKLEGSWRGLNYLVMNSETGTMMKIRVLNVAKRELFKDVDNATEFDQSQIFKKLYENEFGTPGGQPYGTLIGDYEFTNHPEDIALLGKMSNVAAAAFCPFLSAASPELFGFKEWTELTAPRDLQKIFDNVEYTQWKSFRNSEDSRFVSLALPRVLSRLPYGKNTKPVDEFNYEEIELDSRGKAKPVPHEHYAWMNAAYVQGTKMTSAFSQYQWCTAIRGLEGGGKVEGLPAHIFTSDDGDPDLKCPTEIGITDRREKELSDCGFMPLSHYKNTDYAVFFGGQTAQKPKVYEGADGPDATANAAISARLPYIMAVSRIAHYLKVMARDWIGSAMEAEDCEGRLNKWIQNYVAKVATRPEDKAKWPLREAIIKVEADPSKPGSYQAKAYLRPWLQLEELTARLMLVARIPKKL
jgi:type VI secretion system protein ImpC